MKKGIDIATLLFAPWALFTGILDSDIHVLVSAVFTLLICIHTFLYRKMLAAHFKGLRWKWVPIGLVCLVAAVASILE
jgi:hypothetical protein